MLSIFMSNLQCSEERRGMLEKSVDLIVNQFTFTDDDVRRCTAQFLRELRLGLKDRRRSMCQIPTYLTKVATGLEKGTSIGVDLGGTNLRVCSVELHGDTTSTVLQSQTRIPHDLMVARTAEELFRFIALQIKCFLKQHYSNLLQEHDAEPERPVFSLGFTFSFPAYQAAINSGILPVQRRWCWVAID
ncbi:hypothetical protein F5Y19DRAFT_7328 [Xylariaceae sp. FL1651]|nr:hypothetical protein F5Y19DRAFT_7328 [Xylariaceae sp. FL1651]